MRITSLFDIVSEVRGTKLTKIAQIDRVIDWAPVRAVIETVYTTGSAPTGRPSYDGLTLFKIELLRVWYGLRDEGVEEMVNDRISFSRFVGLSLAAPAPDSTTVLRFRRAMAEAGALDQVLREINRQLEVQGLVVKSGAIIDASVTDSPRRPRDRKEYEAVADRREEVDDGSAQECKDRIIRRKVCGKGLMAREQQLNAGISRTRCRIGRTFGAMRRWFRGGTAQYVGLAKTHAQHVMEAIAHNLYRAPGLIVANA